LSSFYQALDCAAANNGLKRRQLQYRVWAGSGFTGLALNISNGTTFLTRTDLLIA